MAKNTHKAVKPEAAEVEAVEPEVAEVEAVEPVVPEGFIMVKAVVSNQYEPFQRIAIPTDYAVPVKMSNWVDVQLKANVIKRA